MMDLTNGIVMTGIGVGIVINLLAIMGLIWKFGSWSGRVTTLLEDHSKDHDKHYQTTSDHGERLAHLEGKLRRVT